MGILDADIYGPSIPKLMNLSGEPELNAGTCKTDSVIKTFLIFISDQIDLITHSYTDEFLENLSDLQVIWYFCNVFYF